MKRLRDWQSRLDAVISARRGAPFAWGTNDCALFACDCAIAVTGSDPADGLRGQYKTDQGATRLMKRNGGMEAIADSRLGDRIAPLMAQVGDVGMIYMEGRPMLAVCVGSHWLAPGPDGLVAMPISAASTAWRVC